MSDTTSTQTFEHFGASVTPEDGGAWVAIDDSPQQWIGPRTLNALLAATGSELEATQAKLGLAMGRLRELAEVASSGGINVGALDADLADLGMCIPRDDILDAVHGDDPIVTPIHFDAFHKMLAERNALLAVTVIATADELVELPDNTVIRDSAGDIGIIYGDAVWYPGTGSVYRSWVVQELLPATLLHRPTSEESR